MTGRRKDLPPPATTDLTALLRSRRAATTPADEPAPPTPPPVTPTPERPRAQAMDRRSWYMTASSAEALSTAITDLYFETRQPKHVVLDVLVNLALEQLDEARRRLTPPADQPPT